MAPPTTTWIIPHTQTHTHTERETPGLSAGNTRQAGQSLGHSVLSPVRMSQAKNIVVSLLHFMPDRVT
ncbi:hypothetical protein ElyMa_004047100 [Elysia marginata]|uniref:Uncharacterized protein n=1 Tax=Elysia marginata TaxID=1093978 RepID=A0AAV4G4Z2_9GAST|nr:hypothetical protein ElyMa_004047100 [Elysia marginata]